MQILVTLIVTHSFPSPPPHTATITNCTIFAAKRIFLTVQVGISLRCVPRVCVCAGYDCSTMCSRDESGLEKGKKKPWETFARRNQIDTREGRTQATNKRQQQQQLENFDRTSPTNRSFARSGRGLYRRWARTEFEISSSSNLAPEKRERERGTRNETRRRNEDAAKRNRQNRLHLGVAKAIVVGRSVINLAVHHRSLSSRASASRLYGHRRQLRLRREGERM